MSASHDKTAIILVDHGSQLDASNALLVEVAGAFARQSDWSLVEPAHMELAEPSIATAFARCVQRGAELVVVFPYFLGPGRHWSEDIPRLAAEAAQECGGVRYVVAAPLGLHPLMLQVIDQRIAHCLQHAVEGGPECEICSDASVGCSLQSSDEAPAGQGDLTG